jgi:para-aminobenzoate synthetase/4-amino-4-deoxychorismate lyase
MAHSESEKFSLIETILWEDSGYYLLPFHMKRLKNSAGYFSFIFDRPYIEKTLTDFSSSFNPQKKYKIRLLLSQNGKIEINYNILGPLPTSPLKTTFSTKRTDKKNIFYYHKTTNRILYTKELETFRKKGFFDIIFTNNENEITEGAISNIIMQKESGYYTPPLSSGLLNGVFRQHLFDKNKIALKEKALFKEDLLSADKIYLINSIRKIVPVILEL